jgi:hypothetical protein
VCRYRSRQGHRNRLASGSRYAQFQARKQGGDSIGFAVDKPLHEVVRDLPARGVICRGSDVDDVPVRLALFSDLDDNDPYWVEIKKWS